MQLSNEAVKCSNYNQLSANTATTALVAQFPLKHWLIPVRIHRRPWTAALSLQGLITMTQRRQIRRACFLQGFQSQAPQSRTMNAENFSFTLITFDFTFTFDQKPFSLSLMRTSWNICQNFDFITQWMVKTLNIIGESLLTSLFTFLLISIRLT